MKSPEVRQKLAQALMLDLVGPWPGHEFSQELLPENPSRWYQERQLASLFSSDVAWTAPYQMGRANEHT